MSIIETSWRPSRGRLLTRLRGKISAEDVLRWQESLAMALARMPAKARFSLLVDLRGYEPMDGEALARVAAILPQLLQRNDLTCTAIANVRDPEASVAVARDEQVFTDVDAAERWLASRPD